MSLKNLDLLSNKFINKYNLYVKAESVIDNSKIRPSAIQACKMLKENGFQAFLVGGCVRDLLMGKSPKDWDLTSNATPDQVKTIFPKHFALGEKHGTITAVLGKDKQDEIEITTYRVEGTYSDGRRPDEVAFANNVEDDLSRRDLTINAMAYDPIENKLIDPYGGQEDINNKIIKAVGDPNKRFEEDGLRTMRVARFASRFGFNIDPITEQAIAQNLETLSKVSKERFTAEVLSTLMTPKPSIGLNILFKTGALSVGDPLLNNPNIEKTFNIIDSNASASLDVKVSILLHFLSQSDLVNVLKNLKFPNEKADMIVFLHSAVQEFAKFHADMSPVGARKFFSYVKGVSSKYPILGGYDKCMSEFTSYAKALNIPGVNELNSLMNEKPLTAKDMAINGKDLITELNMKPGPGLKKVLDSLLNEIISNPELNERSKLLELASKFEKLALTLNTMNKTSEEKNPADWWRMSEPEEQDFLNKEYDLGNGLKFKAKDIPQLAKQVAVPAGPEQHHPEKNQLLHTNLVYDQAKKLSDDPMVWFAAILHDLGKSYTNPKIWPKQHGHEAIGVPYVEAVSDLLNVPPQWKEFAKLVCEHHLKCHKATELNPKTLKKLYESFNSNKELFNSYITSCEADAKGRLGGHALRPYSQKEYLQQKIEEGFEPPKAVPSSLAISGNEIMKELGLKSGPDLGKIMKTLKDMVHADPMINDYDTLLGIAKSLLK